MVEGIFCDHSSSIDPEGTGGGFWYGKGKNRFLVVDCDDLLLDKKSWTQSLEISRANGDDIPWDEIGEAKWYCKRVHGADMYTIFLNLVIPEGFEIFLRNHDRAGFYWLSNA